MREHLPALQVVVPLLGALLCALVRRPGPAWLIATLASLAMPVIAWLLLSRVLAEGVISYHIGGWDPAIGIEYRVDVVNALVLMLVSSMAAVIAPFARQSVAAELPRDRVAWFYAMVLVSLAGLLGITITGDAFNAFVFLEISSLSSYAMIAMGRDRRALVAAYQYLVMGTIGATFYVIGVGLLYTMTGTLNLGLIAERIGAVESVRPVLAALAFIVVGISLKLALFPLYVWLPNAYAYAPSSLPRPPPRSRSTSSPASPIPSSAPASSSPTCR
jgi:multicomponent Na+:H+ antiporter subunit D